MRKLLGMAISMTLAVSLVLLALPRPAQAHCDDINGPVVNAARQALSEGNVRLILPYVKAEAEAELTAAFAQAQAVRQQGGAAQALADKYFFETAVRLHRLGEGAGYTGLKYETDYGPALEAAEASLQSGDLAGVKFVLVTEMLRGVEQRYHAVLEAREHEAKEQTVAASRERAEAELQYEIYIHEVYLAASAAEGHAHQPVAE